MPQRARLTRWFVTPGWGDARMAAHRDQCATKRGVPLVEQAIIIGSAMATEARAPLLRARGTAAAAAGGVVVVLADHFARTWAFDDPPEGREISADLRADILAAFEPGQRSGRVHRDVAFERVERLRNGDGSLKWGPDELPTADEMATIDASAFRQRKAAAARALPAGIPAAVEALVAAPADVGGGAGGMNQFGAAAALVDVAVAAAAADGSAVGVPADDSVAVVPAVAVAGDAGAAGCAGAKRRRVPSRAAVEAKRGRR